MIVIKLEGELVRDWCEYEYDDLEIGGQDVMRAIIDALPVRRTETDGPTREKTYYGRVCLMLEAIE